MGDAQTLRDYWAGHGHAGPSHGAERDAIAWGTPGDFNRCVAQVSAYGRMTEDQAKGYCNLRHHEATGEWTAQHAKEERGKMVTTELAEAGAAFSRMRAALKKAGVETTEIHVEGEGDKDHDGDGLFDADGDGDGAVATRVEKAGPRNPRDTGSGQFRTFQGELAEAKQALAEGRMSDVVELLGSARALAQTDQQRMSLGELQGAIGRTQHIQPEITKVGPHGYSHGWIKAGEGDGPHTHQTEDLPDKVQVGAFNYRKHPDGSYSRHHPGTGNRATSSADRDRYSADELKDLSRSQDGRGSFVMPARPIGSVKEPLRRAQKAKPVVEG